MGGSPRKKALLPLAQFAAENPGAQVASTETTEVREQDSPHPHPLHCAMECGTTQGRVGGCCGEGVPSRLVRLAECSLVVERLATGTKGEGPRAGGSAVLIATAAGPRWQLMRGEGGSKRPAGGADTSIPGFVGRCVCAVRAQCWGHSDGHTSCGWNRGALVNPRNLGRKSRTRSIRRPISTNVTGSHCPPRCPVG